MKARDFLICAVAVPALYMIYLILGFFWSAAKGIFDFFAAIQTNPASFTVVSFVLTVLSAVCAITAFRELEDNRRLWIESWRDFGTQHRAFLPWYGVALVGAALGATQMYMLWTMHDVVPEAYGFRAWVNIVGIVSGMACLLSILAAFALSGWTFWQGRPMKTAR